MTTLNTQHFLKDALNRPSPSVALNLYTGAEHVDLSAQALGLDRQEEVRQYGLAATSTIFDLLDGPLKESPTEYRDAEVALLGLQGGPDSLGNDGNRVYLTEYRARGFVLKVFLKEMEGRARFAFPDLSDLQIKMKVLTFLYAQRHYSEHSLAIQVLAYGEAEPSDALPTENEVAKSLVADIAYTQDAISRLQAELHTLRKKFARDARTLKRFLSKVDPS